MLQVGTSYSPVRSRQSLFGYFLAAAIVANTIPYFIGSEISDLGQSSEAAKTWQYISVATLFSAYLLCVLSGKTSIKLDGTAYWAIGPLSFYLLVNAFFSEQSDTSAAYAILFLAVVISIATVKLRPEEWLVAFRQTSLLSAAVMLAFVLTKHSNGRYYGTVHPNFVGSWIFVQAVLIYLWPGWYRWIGMVALAIFTVVVDSRFCGLALIIFIAATEMLARIRSPRQILQFAIVGLAAILLAGPYLAAFLEGEGARSLSGGIAGRFDRWDLTFAHIAERPWLGYGFRTSRQAIIGGHSGITTIVAELGVIGALIFISLFAGRLRTLYTHVAHPESQASRKLAIMMLGALVAYISPLTFQPNYLNFGDPIGILILLCLFVRIPRHHQA